MHVLIFSSLLAVLRFFACCDLKMIYAACLILCAAGSLFSSNSADSANVFAESNITLSNGVLPMISIIQYPYTNGGKPNYTISQFTLNSKLPPQHQPKNGLQQHLTRENRSDPYLTPRLGSKIFEIHTLRVSFATSVFQNRRDPLLTRPLEISARSKYFTGPLAQFSAHQNFRHAA